MLSDTRMKFVKQMKMKEQKVFFFGIKIYINLTPY